MIRVAIYYYITFFIACFLNPLFLPQMFTATLNQLIAVLLYDNLEKVEPIEISKFSNKCWVIVRGGLDKNESHSWYVILQRYAYDLVCHEDVSEDGELLLKRKLSDYASFNEEISSPVDGVVAKVNKNSPDGYFPGSGLFNPFSLLAGNYVLIDMGNSIYCFIAHFRKNSITVSAGQTIKKGQPIGKSGNSGHSFVPHIHIHLQKGRCGYLSYGVPFTIEGAPGKNNIVDTGIDCKYILLSFYYFLMYKTALVLVVALYFSLFYFLIIL